jgi:ribosomal protein S18 acetylase RimI-like enzyme
MIKNFSMFDLQSIINLEKENNSTPVSKERLLKILINKNCESYIIEDKNELLGYVVIHIHKDWIHLLCLQTKNNDFQLSKEFIDHIIYKYNLTIKAWVHERNLQMQNDFKKMKFKAIGLIPDNFEETSEAAYLFELKVN